MFSFCFPHALSFVAFVGLRFCLAQDRTGMSALTPVKIPNVGVKVEICYASAIVAFLRHDNMEIFLYC